jgi:hypothetical protein
MYEVKQNPIAGNPPGQPMVASAGTVQMALRRLLAHEPAESAVQRWQVL